MECKFNCWIEVFELLEIKVEPYWNVNTRKRYCLIILTYIKVEPYWNVNANIVVGKDVFVKIKVEPYWNVNSITLFCKIFYPLLK